MPTQKMMLAYLDQNVLGHIRDGKLHLPVREDVVWVYSFEHLTEIARGNDVSFLRVLQDLRAQEIEVLLDDQWRITDQAVLRQYECPQERYRRHLENVGDVSVDPTLFTDVIARLAGADNFADVEALSDRICDQLEKIIGVGDSERRLVATSLENALAEMAAHLREPRSLESLRKPLGIHKGRLGNLPSDSALDEIWRMIKDQCGDLTLDQFFGFDPPIQPIEQKRPKYLGIVSCYTTLNFLGYRTDKGLSNSASLPKIMSDGVHVAHAAFCDLLISADRRLSDKASAIFRYIGGDTHVARLICESIAN